MYSPLHRLYSPLQAGCAHEHFRVERGEWVDAASRQEVRWTPHVAEKSKFALEGLGVTRDYLLLSYLDVRTGVPKLVVRRSAHLEPDLGTEELFPPQVYGDVRGRQGGVRGCRSV